MSSPQIEDGYFRIANELAEALARINLSPYESRVVWFVLRKTYGFKGKKMDRISLSQFSHGTGIKPQHVRRAIKSLIDRGILMATAEKPQRVWYGIQKDYEKWDMAGLSSKPLPLQGVPKQVVPEQGVPIEVQTSPYPGNKPLPVQGDTKERNKETKDSDLPFSPIIENVIARLNRSSGKNFKPDSKTTRKNISARLQEGYAEADLLAVVEDRCRRWKSDLKMDQYLRPATLFNSDKFEGYLQSTNSAGNGKPPEIKDLGDGWVELDGRKMSRRDYERRFRAS